MAFRRFPTVAVRFFITIQGMGEAPQCKSSNFRRYRWVQKELKTIRRDCQASCHFCNEVQSHCLHHAI